MKTWWVDPETGKAGESLEKMVASVPSGFQAVVVSRAIRLVEKSAYDELVKACDGLFEALRTGGDSEEGHALIQLGITLTKLRGSGSDSNG